MSSYRDNMEHLTDFSMPAADHILVGYQQFRQPWVLKMRRYLQEKVDMGFLKHVEVLRDTLHHKTCFILVEVQPKLWEKVLRPAIQSYGHLVMERHIGGRHNRITIWINVKRRQAPDEFLAKVQADG